MDSPVKTLSCHDVYSYLRNIKPASMLWSVVNFNLPCEPSCFLLRNCFIKRCRIVCIQIIHDEDNLLCIRIYFIYQILNLFSQVNSGSGWFNRMNNSSCMRLNKTEYTDSAISDVLSSILAILFSSVMDIRIHPKAEMAFHPYITEDIFHHKVAHRCQEYLPWMLQIQHLPLGEYTSTHSDVVLNRYSAKYVLWLSGLDLFLK